VVSVAAPLAYLLGQLQFVLLHLVAVGQQFAQLLFFHLTRKQALLFFFAVHSAQIMLHEFIRTMLVPHVFSNLPLPSVLPACPWQGAVLGCV